MNELATSKEYPLENGKTVRAGQFILTGDRYDWLRIDEIHEDGDVEVSFKSYGGEWLHYGTLSLKELANDRRYIVLDNYEQALEMERDVTENLDKYLGEDEDQADTDTTAMVATSTMDGVKALSRVMEERRLRFEVARRMMRRRADEVDSVVRYMENKITGLKKVLGVFELYLGVLEEITVIRDGPRAGSDEPIHFRQLLLYMDEEVGDVRERFGFRGIDFRSVVDFDDWLVADPRNLAQVLPEKKGLVLIRPSRQRRKYSDDPLFNINMNDKNRETYVLIRNGDALFRIWTGEHLGPRLFPKTEYTLNEERSWWERQEEAESRFSYRRNAMLLQGLLDRTEVFNPLPHHVNLFDPDTYGRVVRFVRDEEFTLPTGRQPFWAWLSEINSRIQQGSRIVFALEGTHDYARTEDWKSRYLTYQNDYPPLPSDGVYQVSWTKDEYGNPLYGRKRERKLRIMYSPEDTVWYGNNWMYDPHPRKNKVSFIIEKSDRFIMNYDQISLDDIEFYMSNRIDRENYLGMLPLLINVRKGLLEEHEKEKDFVRLVAGRTGCGESAVWEAVDWWKFKNQWKRRIDSDDAKALRMIERRLRGKEDEEK